MPVQCNIFVIQKSHYIFLYTTLTITHSFLPYPLFLNQPHFVDFAPSTRFRYRPLVDQYYTQESLALSCFLKHVNFIYGLFMVLFSSLTLQVYLNNTTTP